MEQGLKAGLLNLVTAIIIVTDRERWRFGTGGEFCDAPVIAASGRYSQRAIRTAREPSFWHGSDTLLKLLTRHLSTAALLWALPCSSMQHPVKAPLHSTPLQAWPHRHTALTNCCI